MKAKKVPEKTIDPCPTCGEEVTVISVDHSQQPLTDCGHAVKVTMWPDRVELEKSWNGRE